MSWLYEARTAGPAFETPTEVLYHHNNRTLAIVGDVDSHTACSVTAGAVRAAHTSWHSRCTQAHAGACAQRLVDLLPLELHAPWCRGDQLLVTSKELKSMIRSAGLTRQ